MLGGFNLLLVHVPTLQLPMLEPPFCSLSMSHSAPTYVGASILLIVHVSTLYLPILEPPFFSLSMSPPCTYLCWSLHSSRCPCLHSVPTYIGASILLVVHVSTLHLPMLEPPFFSLSMCPLCTYLCWSLHSSRCPCLHSVPTYIGASILLVVHVSTLYLPILDPPFFSLSMSPPCTYLCWSLHSSRCPCLHSVPTYVGASILLVVHVSTLHLPMLEPPFFSLSMSPPCTYLCWSLHSSRCPCLHTRTLRPVRSSASCTAASSPDRRTSSRCVRPTSAAAAWLSMRASREETTSRMRKIATYEPTLLLNLSFTVTCVQESPKIEYRIPLTTSKKM